MVPRVAERTIDSVPPFQLTLPGGSSGKVRHTTTIREMPLASTVSRRVDFRILVRNQFVKIELASKM